MESKRRSARALVRRMSTAVDDEALASAIAEVRLLSKNDPDVRVPLVNAGAVPLLSRHLICGQNHPGSHEDAAAALLNLSIDAREALMSTPGLLDALTRALASATAAAQHAAATVYSLLSVESHRPVIGSKRGLLAALLALIRSPADPRSLKVKDALRALFGVALCPSNRAAMVELGAVPSLFSLATAVDGGVGIVEDSTAVIAQVAGCSESVRAFRRVGGVRVLVGLLGVGASGRARENAASALLNLAEHGGDEEAAAHILEVEAAEGAIRELAEKGSARAKGKAEALLRILLRGRRRRQRQQLRDFDSSMFPSYSLSSADETK